MTSPVTISTQQQSAKSSKQQLKQVRPILRSPKVVSLPASTNTLREVDEESSIVATGTFHQIQAIRTSIQEVVPTQDGLALDHNKSQKDQGINCSFDSVHTSSFEHL
jgi:hypothetical protein